MACIVCVGSFLVAVVLYGFADGTRVPDPAHAYEIHHHGGGVSYFSNTVGTVIDDAWLVMGASFAVAFALAMLFGERKRDRCPRRRA